jgi:hypothetical protein
MIELSKLTDKRLLAYFKAERKRMYLKYRQVDVGEDEEGNLIMVWENTNKSPNFDKDVDRFNEIKNELAKRKNIK